MKKLLNVVHVVFNFMLCARDTNIYVSIVNDIYQYSGFIYIIFYRGMAVKNKDYQELHEKCVKNVTNIWDYRSNKKRTS
jgi:hypothetical protein